MMAEFSNSTSGGGWIHSVSFSVDGSKLAWVGHDSSISVRIHCSFAKKVELV